MIEVQDLHHRYGPLTAVEDLSFRVQKGEVLGLLGPNGAGKSTTLRAIVGLLTPTRGRVIVEGEDMATDAVAARRHLGFLPEAVELYRELRVDEMLAGFARIKGVSARQVDAEIDRVVEICSLQEVRRRLIGYCSRGYRQRIGLAQALLGDPEVLVLDEPTVGLDPAQVVDIRQRIAELARTKAIILSTHILSEAQALCDRVLILNRGRCVAEDRPEVLEGRLRGGTLLRLVTVDAPGDFLRRLGELEFVQAVRAVESAPGGASRSQVFQVELDRSQSAAALSAVVVEMGAGLLELSPEHLGLEEVFLRLVREEGQ